MRIEVERKQIAVVITTVASEADGRIIAARLIDTQLAGCVQILPPMTSIYAWKGKVEESAEHLVLIKTSAQLWPEVRDLIQATHSYETPEILMFDPENVSPAYHKWLVSVLG